MNLLMVCEKTGQYIKADNMTVLREADRIAKLKFKRGSQLTSVSDSELYLRTIYRDFDYEIFGMLLLDNQHRVIKRIELFNGTIDGASVYPREIVKAVLDNSAATVILFHNHPSGQTEPSQADKNITEKIDGALRTIEVRTLDHIIVGGCGAYSFAQHGLI